MISNIANEFTIRPYRPEDKESTVTCWRKSYEQALGISSNHTFEDQCFFLEHILSQKHNLYIAENAEGNVVGFMAQKSDWIDQLYIDSSVHRMGLGRRFIELAKGHSPYKLQCYSFEKNVIAREFYKKNGFREVKSGGLENEERLPDVLLEWLKI